MNGNKILKNSIVAEVQFSDVNRLINASIAAQKTYSFLKLSQRREIIASIKEKLIPIVPELAKLELIETCMGNVPDKIIKLLLALNKTPGVEDLSTDVLTGDDGMTLYEYSPYGIVCALQPSTNPCATLISNTIGMLAAGNAVIHIPNPRCTESSQMVVGLIREAIREVSEVENLVVSLVGSSMCLADEIMNHPDVDLVVATGSDGMMNKALSASKRVIAAGPANPVAIIDETADVKKAAEDCIEGASFDNGIMCISEKNLVVVNAVADRFVEEMKKLGVHYVNNNNEEMLKLTKATVTEDMCVNRMLKGKSANEILHSAGISGHENTRLIVVDTVKIHPFATLEMMMPLVPMIRVKDFETALDVAIFLEQGYKHTAMIHSQSISHLNTAAMALQTSIFVKNGSSLAGIGLNGEGETSFTIANCTGEGVTTAKHFARRRRCTLTSGFSIR